MINVKDAQFGALGNGQVDDTAAIQRAVNFARTQSFPTGGGAYRITIFFPAGFYYITAPIDLTNANGIWLVGDGGPYLNTNILGNTSGAIFDFSGSSLSGCENFLFVSSTGSGAIRSTIGVQFALTGNGGLNCGIRNCSFQMEDYPTANNGFGSIGILNVRAEEFFINDCLVRANAPVVMSNAVSVTGQGVSFTATSRYQALVQGVGSMGSTNIQGTSLQTYEKRQPALVLNGTNSLSFQGYLSRSTATNGTNETAIYCNQYTTNLRIFAIIESFSRVMRVTNSGFESNEFNIVSSSVTSPTTELFDFTNCYVKGFKLQLSLPVLSERNNRYVIYHAPSSDPNQQAAGNITNSEISCYDINSNQYIISANYLRKGENLIFNTFRPFEKRGGRIRQLSNDSVIAGTVGSPTTATVYRFLQADNFASPNGRGGFYRIIVDGVIRAGSYGSGGTAVLSFQSQILVNQNYLGSQDPAAISVVTFARSATDASYISVNGITVNISFAGGVGTVTVLPRVSGRGTTEPINYDGTVELQNDFLVNSSIPL
ncbi:MAG: hypothetical protein EAZ91_16150 [Cytophagales bacterium]|nr:MAG: hypothetical protein EAZ91_16150 [Cytophagales bacterium]